MTPRCLAALKSKTISENCKTDLDVAATADPIPLKLGFA
jgi:hypothetical protein